MNFSYNDNQRMIADMIQKFGEHHITPNVREWDDNQIFPAHVFKKLGELGSGAGLWESAQIRVNPTGSVEVLTGSHSHGQGHETTFAQLVADKFGISIDDIDISHGDTDKVQFGMGY